jgi:hypothetical protein
MTAIGATLLFILGPMELVAGAVFAEIRSEWLNLEESQQREELSDAILYRRARKAPLVGGFECEAGSGHTSSALLERKLVICLYEGKVEHLP